MPSQDEVMKHILKLVSQGAGEALTPEIESALHERYYPWIAKKKDGVPTSPQDIWDGEDGAKIKRRFEKIGEELSKAKTKTKAHHGKKGDKGKFLYALNTETIQ